MKNTNHRHNNGVERVAEVSDFNSNPKMKSKSNKLKNKNMQRLGGAGLSLEAFANAKSRQSSYNPALLKKKREFYKNAKHVSNYKKLLKQQNQPNDWSKSAQPLEINGSEGACLISTNNKKSRKGSHSLQELYEKKREEKEKVKMEREAFFKTRLKEKEKADSRRKDLREKMFKKTRKGQPVMKYRIEHILETLQGSTS